MVLLLRPAFERVRSLAGLRLDVFGRNVKALDLGEAVDSRALGFDAEAGPALTVSRDSVIRNDIARVGAPYFQSNDSAHYKHYLRHRSCCFAGKGVGRIKRRWRSRPRAGCSAKYRARRKDRSGSQSLAHSNALERAGVQS